MRSLVGTFAILSGIALDAAIVAGFAERLATLPWPAQAAIYALAGIAWVLPAACVTRWMVRG
jgi:Protein of unknown function (DUF2842)